MVLPDPCLLLFGSCLLLPLPENLAPTLELPVDRPRSDCDKVSQYEIVSVGIVSSGVILCVIRECFAQPESRESSCMPFFLFFAKPPERFSSVHCMQPVLGRLVKRAVASMEEYQSKRSLLPRLTTENVVTKEDEDALSSALGGTARLVPPKQGSNSGSHCGTSETESLPPPSPRGTGSSSLSRLSSSPPPQHHMSSPTTALGSPLSPIDSPRTEWQNTWGQVPQNAAYHSMYPTNLASPQWSAAMDATAANWYNAQPIQFYDPASVTLHPQPAHSHHQPPEYVDVTMGNVLPSFGQTSSVLSGAMSSYGYQQQAPPPQNNAQAHWENLFVEMGASYP